MQAIYDVWLLGDQFFRQTFPALQAWRRRTRVQKVQQPYLYDYYNIFGYYTVTTSHTKHTVGCVLNALITALNTRERLPRMILIILDKDLLEDIGIFNFRTDDIIAENIGWLFRQFEILIKHWKMELSDAKPGAVYGNDPKILLVEMLKRPMIFPHGSYMHGVMSMRNKFNAILNDAAHHFGYHRLYIESCSAEYQYDHMGNLKEEAQVDFWKEINILLEKFDCKKIDLKPKFMKKKCRITFSTNSKLKHTKDATKIANCKLKNMIFLKH